MDKVDGIRGKQQILASGKPAKNKDGSVKKISDSTVKQYVDGMRLIGETTGCADQPDFVACLRDTDMVIAKLRKRYPSDVSLKKQLGIIASASKYLPDFRRALGEEAHQVYRDGMIASIKAAEERAISQTESKTAIPLNLIKEGLDDIAEKFGKDSDKFLEAKLQSSSSAIDKYQVSVAKKLYQRLRYNSSTKVQYVQKSYKIPGEGVAFIGRLYPSNQRFVCFQNMLGSLRRILIDKKYVEVDMENAHFQLLAGKYPDARSIHDYISNREQHLLAVQHAAGVKRWVAKQLFIMLIFGGSVDSWKADNNIPETVQLPEICHEPYYTIVALKADFEVRPENTKFVKAAKSKKQKESWQNTAFALWL
eukprot:jgi/Tetstr1/449077/TSEL_036290.t1